jgi:hypothetical protein
VRRDICFEFLSAECDIAVLGPSFRDALDRYATFLEQGKIAWNAGDKSVSAKDWDGNRAYDFSQMK